MSHEREIGSNSVINLRNGRGYCVAIQNYPIQQKFVANTKEIELRKNASQYFGVEQQIQQIEYPMTSFEWALYLAKLIDSHTKLRENEGAGSSYVRWLHK